MRPAARLTRGQELALAAAVAVVTANAYYIHPIIGEVARGFGVSNATIGLVPALNQLALAIGIFLLLPLGDRYSNRQLTIWFTAGQCAGLLAMTFARDFALFTAGSTLLGFFTIAPYLLPAYASRRVAPERLGEVTATLTAGVLFGILVARVGAGWLAEHYGWRSVYYAASALMIVTTVALPRVLDKAPRSAGGPPMRYYELVASTLPLLRSHREIIVSGAIQALGFGQFIALWLGLALHLTGPQMGYGTDVVGYLAGFAAISVLSTPRLGKLADRIGPRRARIGFTLVQFAGLCLLYPFGDNLWLLVIPLLASNVVGPAIDVASRMTFLAAEPELRTRLTTIYVVMMFLGGAVGSAVGTAVYDFAGWAGLSAVIVACSAGMVTLSFYARRRFGTVAKR